VVTQVVEKQVTQVVTQVVEKQVTQVVEKQVTQVVEVTPTPQPASYAGTAPQGKAISFKGIIHVPTWYSRNEPGAAVRFWQGELIREWGKLHKDVDVEMFAVSGGDIRQWMRAQFVADTPPELAIYYPVGDEFINGWWRPIDDLLDQTSPYTGKAWKEDFPYIDVVMQPETNTKKRYHIPIVKTGDAAFYNVGYNADIYRKAGIDVDKDMPPKNWGEWKRMNADIKKAGFIPVSLEITGGLYWQGQHIELPLTEQTADLTLKKIDRAIDASDTNEPDGSLSSKELIYAVATGDLDYSKDKGFREAYRLMKEFFTTMAQPNWSAPSDLQSTYLPRAWYQGKIGAVHVGLHYISELQQLPFEWRTMWWPALSKEDADVPLGPIRRDGSDAPAGFGTEPFVIPTKTAKNDTLFEAALDLIQYTTRPDAIKFWCGHQLVPCFDPGKTEKEVWPNDEKMQKAMYGLFHPPIKGRTMRRAHMEAWGEIVERPAFQALVEYFQDKTTLDDATQKIQALVLDRAKKQCADLKLSFCGKFA
jgi:ABC-type glycerol-3-phosphate transport system substrate-binding protein